MNRDQRFSFEFFPPKTDAGKEKLKLVSAELNALGPDFFSVTYGAGGSTRANTKDTVISMNAAGISTVPNLFVTIPAITSSSRWPLIQKYTLTLKAQKMT
jgi:methylenetetrahydrofolate reductase (NADPH)